MILNLLDEEANPFGPCRIDTVASYVKIIGIEEESYHYE